MLVYVCRGRGRGGGGGVLTEIPDQPTLAKELYCHSCRAAWSVIGEVGGGGGGGTLLPQLSRSWKSIPCSQKFFLSAETSLVVMKWELSPRFHLKGDGMAVP